MRTRKAELDMQEGMTVFVSRAKAVPLTIPHVCISCGDETDKGDYQQDRVLDRYAWFCLECLNTVNAIQRNERREA